MADSAQLVSYIVENATRLDLQVSKLTWFEEHGIPLSDIEVTCSWQNGTRRGRGSASTDRLAVVKAFAEAAERDVMNEMEWPSSNGVAAHTSVESAKKAARQELLERDAFFKRFCAGESFGSYKGTPRTEVTSRVIKILECDGVEVRESTIHYASVEVKIVTLLGERARKRFGMILGSAADSDGDQAFERALIEAVRFYAIVSTSDRVTALSESEFEAMQFPTLSSHGRLGLDVEYARWFAQNHLIGTFQPRGAEPEVKYQVVDNTFNQQKPPLYVVRAESPSIHQLYVGYAGKTTKPHPFW